jgi:hypothetical protein
MRWRRQTRTVASVSTIAIGGGTHDDAGYRDEWSDVSVRARVVHSLACAGASVDELARLAANDAAVVMAAIVYDGGHPRDYAVLARGEVVDRLNDLLRTIAWGCRGRDATEVVADLDHWWTRADRCVGAATAA